MKRIYNGFTTESQRTNDGPALRLPAPSLRGRAGGEAESLFPFHNAKLLTFPESLEGIFGFLSLKSVKTT